MFVHLRTHSYYSFLEALPSPAELAQAAASSSMPALGLADHQGLSGAVEFYDACYGLGVRPLLGLELDIASPAGALAFLAMDIEGWRSLCRLSSAAKSAENLASSAARSGQHAIPLPMETLSQDTAGLICLTGGKAGPLQGLLGEGREKAAATYLGRLGELFPGRLYVELQIPAEEDQPQAGALAALARRLALPVVATHCIYSLEPAADLLRVMAAIRLTRPVADLSSTEFPPKEAHFLSQTEMAVRFAAYPQALAATLEVADRCRLELPLGVPHFPDLDLPDGKTPIQVLREKAEQGARRLYGNLTPQPPSLPGKGESDLSPSLPGKGSGVRLRLDHELSVIEQCGYASLFLVMEEILGYARKVGVPVSSRGSAASSLVAHCLGITSPDPLRLNLYFERFLNPARLTPPDIDTDLCSRRRDEVIRFVYERFGAERVAMVCTISRFRRRSALREVAKAYGLLPAEIKKMVDSLPYRGWGPPAPEETAPSPYADLAAQYPSPRYGNIFRDAAALLGLPHYLSVHPGGVVIAPGKITDLAPVQMAAKGVVITQFDMDSIERLGLVKIDLLGIKGLTVLGDVAERMTAENRPQTADGNSSAVSGQWSAIDWLEAIPEDDPATAEMVRAGRTIGCFQIESPGMRLTLKEIQAHSMDDLMVALALYRPGPLTGGLKDAFVRRHRGQEQVTHLHPALAPLLEDTYGVILYQEQVLRIAHDLAGLSLADADLLRRAMSHFDPGKAMQTLKEKFIAGAFERRGVPEGVAERVWELMAAFAGYGFPKAHAASYAQVAWRAAWCKTHYPALFMACVLANWGGYYSQRVYLTEARRMGLALHPPHINWAGLEFSLRYWEDTGGGPSGFIQPGGKQPGLFLGLEQVRDLTRRTQERILGGRPFHSLEDFLARADPRPVEAENLVRVGALEGMGSIPALLRRLLRGGWRGGQLALFSLDGMDTGGPEEEEWSLAERVAAQEAILGIGVAAHPLELVADEIAAAGAVTTVEAAAHVGQKARIAGTRQTWTRTRSAHGEMIYFMSLEDLEGMLEVVIPAGVYRRNQQDLSGHDPILVEGVVELDYATGEPFIRADRVSKVENRS